MTNNVIPKPASYVPREGHFTLTPDTVIRASPANAGLARYLADALRPATGLGLSVSDAVGDVGGIRIVVDPALSLGDEGYHLRSTPQQVIITASAAAGAFYGIQTLLQLLPAEVYATDRVEGVAWTIPCADIEDRPRFGWRGLMIDVSRYFMPAATIKRFIDLLAMHKMNVLHWHLTDDQGWRIEIKKYPRLTEVGAWRKQTLVGHLRDQRDVATQQFDGKPHGGFYTQDEVRDIVRYAAERHVTVVPEIELPGHSRAAIAAYPELGCTGGPLEVGTYWGVDKNILNADDATIRFYQDVLDEVLALFPSRFIHIGGDEAAKDQWIASPAIQARIKALGLKDEHELQSWFIRQMDQYLTARGRRLIGWDEILEGGLAENATVMSWRGIEGGIAAARQGRDVVMSPNQMTYFDYYQSADHAAEPLAIGGTLPLRKVYEFEPIPAELSVAESQHILGGQGQLWTEYIPTPRHMEYMAFPRTCALAETLWSPREARDFAGFAVRLPSQLQRLAKMNVHFRTPRDGELDAEPQAV